MALKGACPGEERHDLVGILDARRPLDAGGNVHRDGMGGADGFAEIVGGKPAGEHPGERPAPVSAMMRRFPMRRASKICPMVLLILCAPV